MISQIAVSLFEISAYFFQFMMREVIYSSVVLVAVLALSWVLRKRSLHVQFGLFGLVFLRLVLPPDLSFSFSARSVLDRTGLFEIGSEFSPGLRAPGLQPEAFPVPEVQSASAAHLPSPGYAALSQEIGILDWLQIAFLLLWCLGVILFLGVFTRRLFYYRKIVLNAETVGEPKFTRLLLRWRHRFGVKQNVRLIASEQCLSPFTMGLLQPVIYLPKTLLKTAPLQTVEAIIAHEFAHVKNRDDLWIKLQNFIQIVYFFHPAVWLVTSRLNDLRERICDERVLSSGEITPAAYGDSMLAVLKMNLLGVEGAEMLPSFGNHKKKLSGRIRKIVAGYRPNNPNFAGLAGGLTLSAVLLLPMAESAGLRDSGPEGCVKLDRVVGNEGDFKFVLAGAGTNFKSISPERNSELFCDAALPASLAQIEYAAVGFYDHDFRKIWMLKGVNSLNETEFYLDTDGDNCFTDEKRLAITRKTAKYNYEGSPEWTLTEYLKSQVMIRYGATSGPTAAAHDFAIYLVYIAKKNFLEFANNEFWVGQAEFNGIQYPVALYGGVHSSWFLRATFDERPGDQTLNEFRIDLNRNGIFEDMSVYDPGRNDVIREKYYTNEPFTIAGQTYAVESVTRESNSLLVKIVPKTERGS